jgi:putative oxidoreductase
MKLFEKRSDLGLLIIRLGLGAMMIYHGAPKFFGGPSVWSGLGEAVKYVGIHGGFEFWGMMAAFAEFVGGICLILGLFVRLFSFLLVIDMAVASFMHMGSGDGLLKASHAIELGIVFLGLMFLGSGAWSLCRLFKKGCCCQGAKCE